MPKWFPYDYIILTEKEVGHFYTFWTMPIMIFSPVSNFDDQSLVAWYFRNVLIPFWSSLFKSQCDFVTNYAASTIVIVVNRLKSTAYDYIWIQKIYVNWMRLVDNSGLDIGILPYFFSESAIFLASNKLH